MLTHKTPAFTKGWKTMAIFYNQANLSYSGGNTNSNIVTGEIVEVLTATKTAVTDEYGAGDTLSYIVSILNSGTTPFTGLTVTDNLGEYELSGEEYEPLTYIEDSVKYYQNGVLQATPSVTDVSPLVITGITVPAGGNAMLIYSVRVNDRAPLDADGEIENTVTVTGNGITTPIQATETVETRDEPLLTITKGISPTTVTDNGELTYTLTIQNIGNTAAVATDDIVVTDNFDPVLENIIVTLNGEVLTEGTDYTYNEATGEFATIAGVITVPAATFVQNPETGEWAVTPGVATLVIRGTV